jgi:hypothetical protein
MPNFVLYPLALVGLLSVTAFAGLMLFVAIDTVVHGRRNYRHRGRHGRRPVSTVHLFDRDADVEEQSINV